MDDKKIIELLESSDPDECRLGLELHSRLDESLQSDMAEAWASANITIAKFEQKVLNYDLFNMPFDKGFPTPIIIPKRNE